jgi:DNA (cytosine-5)-methyltransferase 1
MPGDVADAGSAGRRQDVRGAHGDETAHEGRAAQYADESCRRGEGDRRGEVLPVRVPRQLTVGSLFSGIGGFDLGFERAGMRTVWFCEQDPFCQRVLAKHWPGVPVHDDVRALVADTERGGLVDTNVHQREHDAAGRPGGHLAAVERGAGEGRGEQHLPVRVPRVDVLCGGFPCQDISVAGRGEGIDGARSGLWAEYARLIRELRPRYVVVENVAALLARGMERVLGDLAACGYDAEWDCIPASAVGAPHRRDRVWLVAYREGSGVGAVADPGGVGCERGAGVAGDRRLEAVGGEPVGDARDDGRSSREDDRRPVDDAGSGRHGASEGSLRPGRDGALDAGWWLSEPDVGRVAHGVPARVDRLRSLGNALVPQIAEWIGHRIVALES